jgi:hypothetical protein
VALEMPPVLTWYAGRETVVGFLGGYLLDEPGRFRLVPVMANGQPALAAYQRHDATGYHAHAVVMPTLTTTGISHLVFFLDPARYCLNQTVLVERAESGSLFPAFGLPQDLDVAAAGPAPAEDRAVTQWHR